MKTAFNKAVAVFALVAMTVPAFATMPEYEQVDPNQDPTELALERGLTPDEFLDSVDYQSEDADAGLATVDDMLYQRRPGPPGRGPGRPGPGRPGPRPRPPRRPPPRQWFCEARDRAGYIFQSRDFDLQRARYEAVRNCDRRTRVGGCRLLGCR